MSTRKHWGLGFLTVVAIGPNLMLSVAIMLSQTLVQNSFDTGNYTPMWVVISGNIAYAVFVPLGPVCVKRFGLRSTYVTSTLLFVLGCVLAVISPDVMLLVVARILQGSMTGILLMAMVPSLILSFPVERRNRVLAVLLGGFFGSIALGPVLGSYAILINAWRWLFIVAGVCALVGTVVAQRLLPKRLPLTRGAGGSHDESKEHFDTTGFLLLLAMGVGMTVTLGNLGGQSLDDVQVVTPFLVTIILFALFVVWELTEQAPFVPLRTLFRPKAALGVLLTIASNITMIASLAMLTIILRTVDTISNWSVTLSFLSLLAGVVVAALLATVLHDRHGAGWLGILGSLCMLGVDLVWGSMGSFTSIFSISAELGILGVGAGLTMVAGLVGAALGGSLSTLPQTMTTVQWLRLIFFTMIAPVFSWIVSRQSTKYFAENTWGVTSSNESITLYLSHLTAHFHSFLGLSPIVAKHMAFSTLLGNLQGIALQDTAHYVFSIGDIAAIIMLLLSVGLVVTGKGTSLAVRGLRHASAKTSVSEISL